MSFQRESTPIRLADLSTLDKGNSVNTPIKRVSAFDAIALDPSFQYVTARHSDVAGIFQRVQNAGVRKGSEVGPLGANTAVSFREQKLGASLPLSHRERSGPTTSSPEWASIGQKELALPHALREGER